MIRKGLRNICYSKTFANGRTKTLLKIEEKWKKLIHLMGLFSSFEYPFYELIVEHNNAIFNFAFNISVDEYFGNTKLQKHVSEVGNA